MGRYGLITTTSNTASQLKELNKDYEKRRTWASLYGSVDLAEQQVLSSLQYDYSKDVLDAYATAYGEKSVIANSALGSGYKEQSLYDINESLNEAFNSYRQNYMSNVAAVKETSQEAKQGITDELILQAENVNKYRAMPYQYLTNLYNRSIGTEDVEADDKLAKMFVENPNWNKYLVTDETGTRLKTEQELLDEHYVDGKLTIRGADFYDQMLNELGTTYGSEYSFHNWLANEDAELYEWSQSYNPYNYAPNMLGESTNLSSVQTMFGLASDDQTYQFVERYAGMSEGELDAMFSRYTKYAEDVANKLSDASGRHTKDVVGDINGMIGEIKTMATELGILDDIEAEIGITFEELSRGVEENYGKSLTNGNIWWDSIQAELVHAGASASVGGTVGTLGGPVGILYGSLIGAAVGVIGGIPKAISRSQANKKENLRLAKESADAYKQLVIKMVNMAQQKRRQAEIDAYKN